jgi:hypothetical protein
MTDLENAIQEYQDQIEKVENQMEEIHKGFSIFPNSEDAKAYGECEAELNRLNDLVSWLTELKERREADEWVPMSERLPDKTGWYLVTCHAYGGGRVVFEEGYRKPENYWTGRDIFKKQFDNEDIIAWRPTPVPYEGE